MEKQNHTKTTPLSEAEMALQAAQLRKKEKLLKNGTLTIFSIAAVAWAYNSDVSNSGIPKSSCPIISDPHVVATIPQRPDLSWTETPATQATYRF